MIQSPNGPFADRQKARFCADCDARGYQSGSILASVLFGLVNIWRCGISAAELLEIDLQPFLNAAKLLYGGPFVAERYAAVGDFVSRHQSDVDPAVASVILGSKRYSASEAYEAFCQVADMKTAARQVFENIDALLLPTTPTTYTVESVRQDPIQLNANLGHYTNFVNLLDLSAVAVPAGFTDAKLPFGVTFIAPAFHDEMLLHTASNFLNEQ